MLEKSGGFAQALKDFELIPGTGEKLIPTSKGVMRVKELEDGSKAVVREFSSSKPSTPTLEIQHANGTKTEIRYK